jgi:hypothetical protein
LYSFTAPFDTVALPSMYIAPLTVSVFVDAFQLIDPLDVEQE